MQVVYSCGAGGLHRGEGLRIKQPLKQDPDKPQRMPSDSISPKGPRRASSSSATVEAIAIPNRHSLRLIRVLFQWCCVKVRLKVRLKVRPSCRWSIARRKDRVAHHQARRPSRRLRSPIDLAPPKTSHFKLRVLLQGRKFDHSITHDELAAFLRRCRQVRRMLLAHRG
jgi:hypothetical protein